MSAISSHIVGSYQPGVILFACVGVERRLIDCPINYALNNNYVCNPADISVNNGNNHETMKLCDCYDQCTLHADTPRLCDNGELRQTSVILQICVNGDWKTLCPSLWGPAQATVACRQLNPGRTVIGKIT